MAVPDAIISVSPYRRIVDSEGNELIMVSTTGSPSGALPVASELVDETGVAYGVKHVGNKPRVSTTPYYVDIAEGNIPDHKALFKYGNISAIGTSFETVWNEGGLYPWAGVDAAPGIVTISSTSAQDTTTTGTGAWTLDFYGEDLVGNEQTETVTTLSGQTPVNSTLSYRRVSRIIVRTAGTAGGNVGVIYVGTGAVTAGVPAVAWASVDVGDNQTLQAIWTVPAGKTFYMTSVGLASDVDNGSEMHLRARPPGEVFQIKYLEHIFGGAHKHDFEFPLVFTAGTDIDIQLKMKKVVANSSASGTFSGWYE